MKTKLLAFLSVSVLAACFTFCSDEAPAKKESLIKVETSSSAKAEDDDKSSGIYKGTFVGSTGTFKLVIEAGQVIGYLVVDEKEYILTTEDIQPSDMGKAITNALFTNADGTVKLWFSVEANGDNPTVTVEIVGHDDIQVVVFKEKSDVLLKIFEGFEYRSYPNEGVQVKAHLNIILNHDSIARVTYKTIGESKLNNGVNGTHGAESWASDAYYGPNNVPFPEVISIYRYYPNPENPEGPYLIERFFGGESMKYSDMKIDGKRQWQEGEFTYSDSTRLLRKL